jgi:hypothetical protein
VVVRCLTKRNGNEKNEAAAPGTGNVRAAAREGAEALSRGVKVYDQWDQERSMGIGPVSGGVRGCVFL